MTLNGFFLDSTFLRLEALIVYTNWWHLHFIMIRLLAIVDSISEGIWEYGGPTGKTGTTHPVNKKPSRGLCIHVFYKNWWFDNTKGYSDAQKYFESTRHVGKIKSTRTSDQCSNPRGTRWLLFKSHTKLFSTLCSMPISRKRCVRKAHNEGVDSALRKMTEGLWSSEIMCIWNEGVSCDDVAFISLLQLIAHFLVDWFWEKRKKGENFGFLFWKTGSTKKKDYEQKWKGKEQIRRDKNSDKIWMDKKNVSETLPKWKNSIEHHKTSGSAVEFKRVECWMGTTAASKWRQLSQNLIAIGCSGRPAPRANRKRGEENYGLLKGWGQKLGFETRRCSEKKLIRAWIGMK